jgi:hypothetical protein
VTGIESELTDIPEPERALEEPEEDTSVFDPGGDAPVDGAQTEFDEEPAFDPGGAGSQPDVAEEAESHR